MQHTGGEFGALLDQIDARLSLETDLIANMATFTAMLFEGLEAVDWVGIYFLREHEFVLGPFQGRTARTRLPFDHPSAGRAVHEQRPIIIDDMSEMIPSDDEFPARSQLVLPLFSDGRPVAVLQVDSPFIHRFTASDADGIEKAARLLLHHSDAGAVKPAKSGMFKRMELPKRRRERPAATVTESGAAAHYSESAGGKRRARAGRGKGFSAPVRWTFRLLTIAAMIGFFAVAMSNAVYEATSPVVLPYHVLLRKTYSVGAFALVAAFAGIGWRVSALRTIWILAGYSALIEAGQAFMGSQEGLISNLIDVVCGAGGGYLGSLAARQIRRRSRVKTVTSTL